MTRLDLLLLAALLASALLLVRTSYVSRRLFTALDRQGAGRNVAGDHRPGPGDGIFSDGQRGNQHGV